MLIANINVPIVELIIILQLGTIIWLAKKPKRG